MNRILVTTAALLFSLWHATASPAGAPYHFPGAFAQWGVISSIDVAAGRLVVDDITVQISPDLRVMTVNTRHETVHGLRPGMRVAWGAGGARTPGAVTELWVLPADYRPSRTPR